MKTPDMWIKEYQFTHEGTLSYRRMGELFEGCQKEAYEAGFNASTDKFKNDLDDAKSELKELYHVIERDEAINSVANKLEALDNDIKVALLKDVKKVLDVVCMRGLFGENLTLALCMRERLRKFLATYPRQEEASK